MQTVDPDILLCSMVLMCGVDSSDVLKSTLFGTSQGPNSTSGAYGLHICTVKLT